MGYFNNLIYTHKDKLNMARIDLEESLLNKLSEIMQSKGITMQELAEKLGHKSSKGVNKFFTSNKAMTLKNIAEMFFVLGESLEVVTKTEYNKRGK